MSSHSFDFSKEKRPSQLLPAGHRVVTVTEMIFGTSKKGNPQFITSIEDVETKKSMLLYLVSVPGKMWKLKSFLDALGLKPDFDTDQVIGKRITAIVEHKQEPWINQDGVTVQVTKCDATDFYAAPRPPVTAWEEEEGRK